MLNPRRNPRPQSSAPTQLAVDRRLIRFSALLVAEMAADTTIPLSRVEHLVGGMHWFIRNVVLGDETAEEAAA